MATRSRTIIKRGDRAVHLYKHHDGYPGYMLRFFDHFFKWLAEEGEIRVPPETLAAFMMFFDYEHYTKRYKPVPEFEPAPFLDGKLAAPGELFEEYIYTIDLDKGRIICRGSSEWIEMPVPVKVKARSFEPELVVKLTTYQVSGKVKSVSHVYLAPTSEIKKEEITDMFLNFMVDFERHVSAYPLYYPHFLIHSQNVSAGFVYYSFTRGELLVPVTPLGIENHLCDIVEFSTVCPSYPRIDSISWNVENRKLVLQIRKN
jgi:hypothetical protein